MQEIGSLYSLNRGLVSRFALARADVKRVAMGAAKLVNWIPKVLGPMILRPGTKYIGNTYTNSAARFLRFIFGTDDTSLIELTPNLMRVWINDVLETPNYVNDAVTNGTFATDLSGWTASSDDGSHAPVWTILFLPLPPTAVQFQGGGATVRSILSQQVAVATPNVEHALSINIVRGPLMLRIGTTDGDDSYVTETTLNTGNHVFCFTPTDSYWIRFFSTLQRAVLLGSCTVYPNQELRIATPWGASDLNNIRYDQSGDIVYVACKGIQPYQIERRGTRPGARSWSVVQYLPPDGPFNVQNTSPTRMYLDATYGNTILRSTLPYFKSSHYGCLFSITSYGQDNLTTLGALNATSSATVRVTGSVQLTFFEAGSRAFDISITAYTGSLTLQLQRSYDNGASWSDVLGQTYTGNATATIYEGQTNQIIWYRWKCTVYSSGSAACGISFAGGYQRGVVRVTTTPTPSAAAVEVISQPGSTSSLSTDIWQEGQWSTKSGFPTSVKLHEGRLWWSGINGIWASISDAYNSFDETFLGDAGPINRTIGSGPVDTVNWLASMKALLIGAQGAEWTARSSTLEEAITPTNFNLKSPTTNGSGPVDATKVDQSLYFVDRTLTKVFESSFDIKTYDYQTQEVTQLVPDLALPGIVRMDVQRKPDTRIHAVRSDGTVIVCVLNKAEEVMAWTTVTASGTIEDVVVLPAIAGNLDDQVYYVVNRTINGSTVRFLEKWAQESECRGDQSTCHLADAYIDYSGSPTTTITAAHLPNTNVVVWADGADVGTNDTARPWTQTYTTNGSGQITLAVAASNVTVGLPAVAQFQSCKLGDVQQGTPLNQQKKVHHLGLILADNHPKGLKFGPTLDDTGYNKMDDLPQIEEGTSVGTAMRTSYDQNLIPFPGKWDTDLRICMQAQFPRPCTVMALTYEIERNN